MHLALVVISFLIIISLLIFTLICVHKQDNKLSEVTKECETDNSITVPENNDISIVVLAAVRNAMDGLPYFLSNIIRIKQAFPNTRLVFLENDSIDGSRQYIETSFPGVVDTQIVDPSFEIDKHAKPGGSGKARILKMMALRNQLLTYVKPSDNYVVMCDPDWDICIPIEKFVRAIDHLEADDQIAGIVPMFRNRPFLLPFITYYFDTFAFQSPEFPEPSTNTKEYLSLQYKKWPEEEAIPVESAFGAFAIYRKEDIQGIQYSVLDSKIKGKVRCEHVGFHKSLREKTNKRLELLTWFKIIA
jgi:hypothetical protein